VKLVPPSTFTETKVFEKLGKEGEYQLVGYDNPVHYKDEDGKFQDIDLTVIDGRVEKAPYIAELMTDKIGLSMTFRDTGQRVDMILHDYPYKKPHKMEGNIVEFSDVGKDIDIVFEFAIDEVKIWRILKTSFASKNAHFESIIDIGEGEAGILPKFFGKDAKGRETILETTFDDSIEHITVSGKKVLRQHIYDKFTANVIKIDEKTRVRTPSDDVEYPVMIDPTITMKADTQEDSGQIYLAGSPTTWPSDGYVINKQRSAAEVISNTTGVGTGRTLLPGDAYGVFLPMTERLDVAIIRLQASNSATGTVVAKVYDASTKILLKTGDSFDASLLNTFQTIAIPIPELLTNAGSGYYIVWEFQAGGTGTITMFPTTDVVSATTGQVVERVSGVWTEQPALQAPRVQVNKRNGLMPQGKAGWVSMTGNGLIATSGTDGGRSSRYHRFGGITIPMGATINTATLSLHIRGTDNGAYPFKQQMKAVNDKSFTLPNPLTSHTSYATILSLLEQRTGTLAVPFVKNTAGTLTLDVTQTLPTTTGAFGDRPLTQNWDVKVIVQRLVDQFDYVSDSMFFQVGGLLNQGVGGSYSSFFQQTYTQEDFATRDINFKGKNPNPVFFYKLTTATTLGSSILIPKLVIDFSVGGATVDSTFEADAMLLVQGSVFGRCKNGGP